MRHYSGCGMKKWQGFEEARNYDESFCQVPDYSGFLAYNFSNRILPLSAGQYKESIMRLRRSELSTPASNEHMIEKAAASSADLVFLDLEDSVAPNEKVGARAKGIHALQTLNFGKRTRQVLISIFDKRTPYHDTITFFKTPSELPA